MAGPDRPEWPPRSSRPDDFGEGSGHPYEQQFDDEFGFEPVEDVPPAPPRRPVPRPPAGRRPQRPTSGDRTPAASKAKQTHSKGNLLWRWRRGFFVLALLGMAGVAAGVSAMAQTELPALERARASSFICAAGVEPGQCSANNAIVKLSKDEDRVFVRLDDIPEVVREAVLATEDRDFYDHKGIDPLGIGRALFRDLRGGGATQGGSTITQQLVKNAFRMTERTVTRKVKEAVLAMKLEKQMSKDEIFEEYLNRIYFGRNAYGIQAASWAYFNRPIQEAGLPEAAYLAGLIRAPEAAEFHENPEEAIRRRQTTLDAMVEEGYATAEDAESVAGIPMDAYVQVPRKYSQAVYKWPSNPNPGGGPGSGVEYINDFVDREVTKKLMEEFDYTEAQANEVKEEGGLRVYTTIDPLMQDQAYNAVWSVLDDPAADPAAALVALDDQGWVRAMVGGRDFNAPTPSATVNLAAGNKWGRQVGSTFKPIALATALRQGYSLEKSYVDAPGETAEVAWEGCDTRKFKNYSTEGADVGTLNLVDATRTSSNTGYIDLMVKLGVNPVVETAMDLGFTGDRRGQDQKDLLTCPTTVLGSEGSDPLEMAEVFSTFANQGIHKEPTIITRIERIDEGGENEVLWEWRPKDTPVMTTSQANLVTYALRQVVEGGTGEAAALDTIPAAGKTGTTSSNQDAWFVGYVPKLTTAVWMGYADTVPRLDANGQPVLDENGQPVVYLPTMNNDPERGHPVRGRNKGVTGGSFPAEIWKAFMDQATEGMTDQFVDPTPEELRKGNPIDPDYSGEAVTTTTTIEEDPDLTIPDLTVPPTRPGGGGGPPTSNPSQTTTPTSLPWPPTTPPSTDRGGGGGDDGNP